MARTGIFARSSSLALFLALWLGLLATACVCTPPDPAGFGPLYVVRGAVRDSGGAGLSGVDLRLAFDTLENGSAVSGGDGTYRIAAHARTAYARLTAHDPQGRYRDSTLSVYFDAPERIVDVSLSP